MVSEIVVVPVALLAFGLAGAYTGWKRRRVHAELERASETPIRQLADPGVVELEGTAVSEGDTITAPVSEREAVVAAWKVEEWDERGDTAHWREVARGIEAPAFAVDDGTGTVRVAPVSKRDTAGKWTQTTGVSASDGVRIDDALAEFDAFPTVADLPPDEEPPEALRRLHEDHGLYEDTGSITNVVDVGKKHGRRRYAEAIVAPGDDVYVLGEVVARDDPERTGFRPEDAVVRPPGDGLFVVSNQDAASLSDEFAGSAKLRLVGGAVATVLGLVVAAVLYGPL